MSTKQPKCGICKHEQRAQIDAALSTPHVIAQVARTFGVAESPLRRHRDQGHHQAADVVADQPPPTSSPLPASVPAVPAPPKSEPAKPPSVPPVASSPAPDDDDAFMPFDESECHSEPPPAARIIPLEYRAAQPPPPMAPPANEPMRLVIRGNTLDAALGRAQAAVASVRKTDPVVAVDGRNYKTAKTSDIVKVGRAALLAEGLVLTQVEQRIRAVGTVPVLLVVYVLRYVHADPAQVEQIKTEIPFPSDRASDHHFRAGAASTYALRYTIKRLLLIEEDEDDKVDLQPSIPASEPDPWGIVPERQPTAEERAEHERRLRSAHVSPDLPEGTDKLVSKFEKEARGRQFAKRAMQRKASASGPTSAPDFGDDVSE